ncbi:MAG: lipoate--protein ligase [Deltaproteobacteria bacterium]|nr:lipoate--protein ligase [Deltaproteobacteria bacterium]
MLCLIHSETEPAVNLAAEEYLLKNADEDCFMLWRNHNAIIVGRNQNTMAEIDPDFVERHGIRVVRRITGGGAVYHDLGNINFTFIKATNGNPDIDFAAHTRPILSFLNHLSVPAELDKHNDLIVNGLKISGNAQHIHKKRVLHHGTLLFDADLTMLTAALQVDPATYHDKAVQSIRSRVTNIRSHMAVPLSVEAFMESLMATIRDATNGQTTAFSAADRTAIEELAERKYRSWEWNYGASPDYRFKKSTRTPRGNIAVSLEVQEGTIRALRLYVDGFGRGDVIDMEQRLFGCRHSRDAIRARLSVFFQKITTKTVTVDQLLDAMF